MKAIEKVGLVMACVSAAILIFAHTVQAQAGWTIGLDLFWWLRR